MITALYASLLALLVCALALNVIQKRRTHKVPYADGGIPELQVARSAHSNAVDSIPLALILLFLLEQNAAPLGWVHLFGIVFVLGRVIHARSILKESLKGWVLGMQITIGTIITLSLLNIGFLPFDKLLAW